jgi:hypothetical protein
MTIFIIFFNCSNNNPVKINSTDGNCYGKVKDGDSKAVSGAHVILLSDQYSPSDTSEWSAIDSTETDQNGQYSFTISISGSYNVVAARDSQIAMGNSIQINADSITNVSNLTLTEPGSLSGRVHLQYMKEHLSVIILFKGIKRYAVPMDSSGSFSVSGLASGPYHLKCISTTPGFCIAETSVVISTGKNSQLPLIELKKKSKLAVENFLMVYDSALKIAHLSWIRPIDTASISKFNIYINRTKDYKPFKVVDNSVSKIDLDLIEIFAESLTISITAVDTSGFEGSNTEYQTFQKEDLIHFVKSITIPIEYINAGQPLRPYFIIDNNSNLYLYTYSDIDKFDSNGVKVASFHLQTDSSEQFLSDEQKIQVDKNGNVYTILKSWDPLFKSRILQLDNNLQIKRSLIFEKDSNVDESSLSFIVKNDQTLLVFMSSNYVNNDLKYIKTFDSNFIKLNERTIDKYMSFEDAFLFDNKIFVRHPPFGTAFFDTSFEQLYFFEEVSHISQFFSPSDTINREDIYYNFSDLNSKDILVLARPLKPFYFNLASGQNVINSNILFVNNKYQVFVRFPTSYSNDELEYLNIRDQRFQLDNFGNFYILTINTVDGKMSITYKKYYSETLALTCKDSP